MNGATKRHVRRVPYAPASTLRRQRVEVVVVHVDDVAARCGWERGVHQHVDAPELVVRPLRQRAHLLPIGDVGRDRQRAPAVAADVGRDLLEGRRRACREDDVGAVDRGPACQRRAEPGPGADDHHDEPVDEHRAPLRFLVVGAR